MLFTRKYIPSKILSMEKKSVGTFYVEINLQKTIAWFAVLITQIRIIFKLIWKTLIGEWLYIYQLMKIVPSWVILTYHEKFLQHFRFNKSHFKSYPL